MLSIGCDIYARVQLFSEDLFNVSKFFRLQLAILVRAHEYIIHNCFSSIPTSKRLQFINHHQAERLQRRDCCTCNTQHSLNSRVRVRQQTNNTSLSSLSIEVYIVRNHAGRRLLCCFSHVTTTTPADGRV